MAAEVSQNAEISERGERTEGEKKSVLLSIKEERIMGAYTLRNESEAELLTPT